MFYLGSKLIDEDEIEGGETGQHSSVAKSLKLGDVSDIRPGQVE